ncbi:Peroxisomal nicotinamide adenine dinucleotide carrier [Acorus calamus]|uniref:Peroxisomal nicotinamide adenine dinucleotide carrier n=1 Tax=Acorus calamus TaxID=4465 RepID=A0AAV9E8U3_ACOCL|nr:Peroxisomal nicotinamide adenine dinucleotide carrier [Acorus calamus]
MSNAVANGLAGAGGGIIAQIITYPLQTVNTRQQTERVAKKSLDTTTTSEASPPSPPPPRGTLFQIFPVIRTEGCGGLYSGLKPSLFGTAASQGIYYYFYQVFKNKAEAIAITRKRKGLGDGTVGMFSWIVVAAIAGSLNVLFTNPIWVLVTRMQTHTQAEKKVMEGRREALLREASECSSTELPTVKEKLAELDSIKPRPYGTLHAAGEVYCEAGITGFWKGIIPTLIMKLRFRRAANKRGSKNVTALEVFLLGALAKLGATLCTYPLLVVKMNLHLHHQTSMLTPDDISFSRGSKQSKTLVEILHFDIQIGYLRTTEDTQE